MGRSVQMLVEWNLEARSLIRVFSIVGWRLEESSEDRWTRGHPETKILALDHPEWVVDRRLEGLLESYRARGCQQKKTLFLDHLDMAFLIWVLLFHDGL